MSSGDWRLINKDCKSKSPKSKDTKQRKKKSGETETETATETEMGKAEKEQLNRALTSHLNTIHETLQVSFFLFIYMYGRLHLRAFCAYVVLQAGVGSNSSFGESDLDTGYPDW